MGRYDYVAVHGDWCRCSEGHDLRGEVLQTKDLGSTFGNWELGDELTGEPGGWSWGEPVELPFSGELCVYTFCRACPAFLQRVTWNVLKIWVEFQVDLEAGRVVRVWRISDPSADQFEEMRREGALGPMTLDEAVAECGARRAAERSA